MAQVRYSSGNFNRYCAESPEEILSATGSSVKEQIVQQCLKKFYEIHSTVDCYTSNKARFKPSSTLKDESEDRFSGLMSYIALKNVLESSASRQALESAGLNQDEMSLLLEICNGNDSAAACKILNGSEKDISARHAALESLLRKISCNSFMKNDLQPEQFKDVLVFESRRDFEAAVRDGVVDRELHCQQRALGASFTGDTFVRVIPKKRPAVHPDHPLNHLADIDRDLFPKKKTCRHEEARSVEGSDTPDGFTMRKIGTSCQSEITEHAPEASVPLPSNSAPYYSRSVKSQWDVRESDDDLTIARLCPAKHAGSEEKQMNFSKEFVVLPKIDDLLPLPLIKEHCMPEEELLKDFPRYCRGTPSKTLYLKNVHKRVTPTDLVAVFGNFDTMPERATYRMFAGRMRGQAFIRFANIAAATRALETCFGFKLKGKPLIIEYGKQS